MIEHENFRQTFTSNNSLYVIDSNGNLNVVKASNNPKVELTTWENNGIFKNVGKNWIYDIVFANNNGIIYTIGNRSTDISDVKKTDLIVNIFPNPTQEVINIDATFEFYAIKIHSFLGNEIFNKEFDSLNKTTIDISSLPVGTYFISLINNKDRYTYKFVIN